MTALPGILAIFNDCRAGREAEFEAGFFQGEHLLERLAVPGFLFGRRHRAISGAAGYFISTLSKLCVLEVVSNGSIIRRR